LPLEPRLPGALLILPQPGDDGGSETA